MSAIASLAARKGDHVGAHAGAGVGRRMLKSALTWAAFGSGAALVVVAAAVAAPAILTLAGAAATGVAMGAAVGAAGAIGGTMGATLAVGSAVLSGAAAGISKQRATEAKGPVKAGGGCSKIDVGSPNVFIENMPAARAQTDTNVHTSPTKLAEGSATVFVNGKPLSRLDDKSCCGGKVITSAQRTWVGGPPSDGGPGAEPIAAGGSFRLSDLDTWNWEGVEMGLNLASLAIGVGAATGALRGTVAGVGGMKAAFSTAKGAKALGTLGGGLATGVFVGWAFARAGALAGGLAGQLAGEAISNAVNPFGKMKMMGAKAWHMVRPNVAKVHAAAAPSCSSCSKGGLLGDGTKPLSAGAQFSGRLSGDDTVIKRMTVTQFRRQDGQQGRRNWKMKLSLAAREVLANRIVEVTQHLSSGMNRPGLIPALVSPRPGVIVQRKAEGISFEALRAEAMSRKGLVPERMSHKQRAAFEESDPVLRHAKHERERLIAEAEAALNANGDGVSDSAKELHAFDPSGLVFTREGVKYGVDRNPGNFTYGADGTVSRWFDPIAMRPVDVDSMVRGAGRPIVGPGPNAPKHGCSSCGENARAPSAKSVAERTAEISRLAFHSTNATRGLAVARRYFTRAELTRMHPELDGAHVYHGPLHTLNVAGWNSRIAKAFGVSGRDLELVELAGLLHDLDPARVAGKAPSVPRTIDWIRANQERLKLTDVERLEVELMIRRTEFPFTQPKPTEPSYGGRTPAEIYEDGLRELLAIRGGNTDRVAFVMENGSRLSNYADQASWYAEGASTMDTAIAGLSTEIGVPLPALRKGTPGFLSGVGNTEIDNALASRLGLGPPGERVLPGPTNPPFVVDGSGVAQPATVAPATTTERFTSVADMRRAFPEDMGNFQNNMDAIAAENAAAASPAH